MADAHREVALITGASSGIGASIARQLAARGAHCILTARRAERLEALRDELIGTHAATVEVITHDLAEPDAGSALHQKVAELGAEVNVLINNAGFGVYGNLVDQELSKVEQMVRLNAVNLTALTHLYAGEMVARKRGRILQVSSIGAFQPSPLYAVYSATKAYVLMFSEAMNWELRRTGVTVTTMCPGLTDTEFHAVADHLKPKSMDRMTMSADKVARIGLRAMDKGRALVTPGFVNKLSAWLVRWFPRRWVTALAGWAMKKRR